MDNPGFNDTSLDISNDQHLDRIIDFCERHDLQELKAIFHFVDMKNSKINLKESLSYLVQNYGNRVYDSVVLILSKCDGIIESERIAKYKNIQRQLKQQMGIKLPFIEWMSIDPEDDEQEDMIDKNSKIYQKQCNDLREIIQEELVPYQMRMIQEIRAALYSLAEELQKETIMRTRKTEVIQTVEMVEKEKKVTKQGIEYQKVTQEVPKYEQTRPSIQSGILKFVSAVGISVATGLQFKSFAGGLMVGMQALNPGPQDEAKIKENGKQTIEKEIPKIVQIQETVKVMEPEIKDSQKVIQAESLPFQYFLKQARLLEKNKIIEKIKNSKNVKKTKKGNKLIFK